jgi:hypothetical protein
LKNYNLRNLSWKFITDKVNIPSSHRHVVMILRMPKRYDIKPDSL